MTDYGAVADALLAAGLPLVGISNGAPVYSRALTGPEQTTANGVTSTAVLITSQRLRAKAKALLALTEDISGIEVRGLVLAIVDELNTIRARIRAMDAVVAGAATLAALKTAWAVLAPMPDRTGAQARTSINNHIDAGDADV